MAAPPRHHRSKKDALQAIKPHARRLFIFDSLPGTKPEPPKAYRTAADSKDRISDRYSRAKKTTETAKETHSAMGKAHHTALTCPTKRAKSQAAGTKIASCRKSDCKRL